MSGLAAFFEFAASHPFLALIFLVIIFLIVIAITIIMVLSNFEKAQMFGALVLKAFAWISPRLKRKQVEFDIEGHINFGVASLENTSLGGIGLPNVKLEWVQEEGQAHDFKDNTLILRMKPSKDNSLNISNVALAVARDAVIRESGSYVSNKVEMGLEFSVARGLLKQMNHPLALRHFTNNIIQSALEDQEVRETFQLLESIEDAGLFTRCLLLEFSEIAAKLYPSRIKDPRIIEETHDFLKFLYDYAVREIGDDTRLWFYRDIIAVGFVIVAKQEKLTELGYTPYVDAVLHHFANGAENVYVSAFDRNSTAAQDVASIVLRATNPTTRLPVFQQTGERKFQAKYVGKTHDVLLVRLTKLRGTSNTEFGKNDTETISVART